MKRLLALVWLLAAGFAFVAAALGYRESHRLNWMHLGPALFCLSMGFYFHSIRR